MAESKPEEADEENGGEAPKKSKKKLIIIILAVLLIAGGGAGAYFGGFIGGKKHEAAEGEEAHGEEAAHGEEKEHGEEGEKGEGKEGEHAGPAFVDLPEFLVNLNTGSRQTSFLKMTVTLELAKKSDEAVVQANMPRVQDSFNTYLRELRASDLYGSAGIYRLREELLVRVNKAVAPAKVNDILFKQMLVQ